jgi:hypothetical protein
MIFARFFSLILCLTLCHAARGQEPDIQKVVHLKAEAISMPREAAIELVDASSQSGDHTPMLESAREKVSAGEAKAVALATLIARSGQRAKVESKQEVSWVSGYRKAKGSEEYEPIVEDEDVGTIFEVDPVIGADGRTLDVNLVLEHHYAPPEFRSGEIVHPGTGEPVKIDLPTFFLHKITTAVTLGSGQAKIVAVWSQVAEGEDDGGKGDAAAQESILVFVTGAAQPAHE